MKYGHFFLLSILVSLLFFDIEFSSFERFGFLFKEKFFSFQEFVVDRTNF